MTYFELKKSFVKLINKIPNIRPDIRLRPDIRPDFGQPDIRYPAFLKNRISGIRLSGFFGIRYIPNVD